MTGMDIDILIFDGFDELDAIAPFEVLRNAEEKGAELHARLAGVHGPGEVVAAHGLRMTAVHSPSDGAELVLVPGGGWNGGRPQGVRAEVEEGTLPRLVAAAHARGAVIASVCTGAMALAAAGVLDGRRATTHHEAIEDLRAAGADVVVERVVDDGDVVSCGGITSGIDLALWLVERFAGDEIADRVARDIEHDRVRA
jgi:transcriptional regulator GlxA family with amidase domain